MAFKYPISPNVKRTGKFFDTSSKSSKIIWEKIVPSFPSQHFEGQPSQELKVNDLAVVSKNVFIF
ncbi:MAG: hypothetical protein U9N59_07425 [Campylobacterota bacterium]|nr:hypothetical protein [Campylobacterota bacterium]